MSHIPNYRQSGKGHIASSVTNFRSDMNYLEFFRMNSNREEGWLDISFADLQSKKYVPIRWEKRWAVFDFKSAEGGVLELLIEPNDYSNFVSVPMESVVSFKTIGALGPNTMKLTTTDKVITMRAKSLDEMKNWIFTFQKSVALVLSILIRDQDNTMHKSSVTSNNLGSRKVTHLKSSGLASHPSTIFSPLESNDDIQNANLMTSNTIFRKNAFDSTQYDSPASNGAELFNRQKSIDYDTSFVRQLSSSYAPATMLSSTNIIPIARNKDIEIQEEKIAMKFEEQKPTFQSLRKDFSPESLTMSDQSIRRELSNETLYSDDALKIGSVDDNELLFELEEHDAQSESHNIDNIELRWISGSCSRLGPRKTNEDRFVVDENISRHVINSCATSSLTSDNQFKHGYFAVYDGHSGVDAAAFLEEHLHKDICRNPFFETDVLKAIETTCLDIDRQLIDIFVKKNIERGSTALGVFILESQLVLFNVGDSCAILATKDGNVIEIMKPHKPNRSDENERILAANGWITEEKELYLGRLHMMNLQLPEVVSKAESMGWSYIYRTCGVIAVSRSFGDHIYKNIIPGEKFKEYLPWPEEHNEVFMADLIIPNPECTILNLEENYDFLIIASDGLWDVVSYKEAIDYSRGLLVLNKSPNEICEELCSLAINLGSSDNVTVILVKFL